MYNTAQLYELSFVAPQREPRTKPELVFTIKAEHFAEVARRLEIIAQDWEEYAKEYCYPEASFTPPRPDLFQNIEFGYGRCGLAKKEGDEVRLSIALGQDERLHCATLTTKLLTVALAVPIEERGSNLLQQADLEIRCSIEGRGYDHAMGGYVSARLTAWLREQSKDEKAVPVPYEVTLAMRQTWASVCRAGTKRWASECGGRIEGDGRFQLGCLGASLAIFPDQVWGNGMDDPHGVRFGCHNLDSAPQQATLLAGFAKMCELARKAEND